MENKFIDQATDEDRKNYVWNNLLTNSHDQYQTADEFFSQTPLTPADVIFYLEDNDADLCKRFTRLNTLTPDHDNNSLLAKYQRAFIKAANVAYKRPNEDKTYLNALDTTAVKLNALVTDVNDGNFATIPESVKKLNQQIKTAHMSRPVDAFQNAFNIAAFIAYLAIAIAAITLTFVFPAMSAGLYALTCIVAGIAGGGAGYMGYKSYKGAEGSNEKVPKKLLFLRWDDKNPHTIFTPKTKALRHAKSISNIASRKAKMDNVAEKTRSLNPFRSKYVEV